MLLKGMLDLDRLPTISSGNISIPPARSVKYLGVRVRVRMSFTAHVKDIRARSVQLSGQFRRMFRQNYGMSRKNMLVVYKGLFTAAALHSASVWGAAVQRYGRTQLRVANRVVLLACMRVCRTVSTDALSVLLGKLPWELEVLRRVGRFRIAQGQDTISPFLAASDLVGLGQYEKLMHLEDTVRET